MINAGSELWMIVHFFFFLFYLLFISNYCDQKWSIKLGSREKGLQYWWKNIEKAMKVPHHISKISMWHCCCVRRLPVVVATHRLMNTGKWRQLFCVYGNKKYLLSSACQMLTGTTFIQVLSFRLVKKKDMPKFFIKVKLMIIMTFEQTNKKYWL